MVRNRSGDTFFTQSTALQEALLAEEAAHRAIEQARQGAAAAVEATQARLRARLNRVGAQVARLHSWTERSLTRQLAEVEAEEAEATQRLDSIVKRPHEFDDLIERLAEHLTSESKGP